MSYYRNKGFSQSGNCSQRSPLRTCFKFTESRPVLRVEGKVVHDYHKNSTCKELKVITGKIRKTFDPSAFMHLLYLYACRRASFYHWAWSTVMASVPKRQSRDYRKQEGKTKCTGQLRGFHKIVTSCEQPTVCYRWERTEDPLGTSESLHYGTHTGMLTWKWPSIDGLLRKLFAKLWQIQAGEKSHLVTYNLNRRPL